MSHSKSTSQTTAIRLKPVRCSLTGASLGQLPASDLACQLPTVHPIFRQTPSSLLRLAGGWRRLSDQDKAALVLALMLQPTITGPLLTISCQVQLPPELVHKYGPTVIWLARQVLALPKQTWIRLVPPSKAKSARQDFATRLPCFHLSSPGQAKDLLHWYTVTLATHLSLEASLNFDLAAIDQETGHHISESLKQELADFKASRRSKAETQEDLSLAKFRQNASHWYYVLQDVAAEFNFPDEWVESCARQLRKTTDIRPLVDLKTCLIGLREVSKVNNRLSLPAIHYHNAVIVLTEIMDAAKVAFLEFDIPTGITFNRPDPIVQNTVSILQTIEPPTKINNPLLAKLQAMGQTATELEAAQAKVEESLTTFVLEYQRKVREQPTVKPSKLGLPDIAPKLLGSLDFTLPSQDQNKS